MDPTDIVESEFKVEVGNSEDQDGISFIAGPLPAVSAAAAASELLLLRSSSTAAAVTLAGRGFPSWSTPGPAFFFKLRGHGVS